MRTKAILLAVACLLAVAALASADSCNPPAGTTCPPNSEYKVTSKGRTKTGSCVACAAGRYSPQAGSCCKSCDGIIYTDPATNVTTCTKCPQGSSLYPRPISRPRQPASTCMCSAGYQATGTSSVTGITGCAKCPAGTFNGAATSSQEACQPCPANSVAPKSGTKACTACKNNSTASADAKSCVCPVNFYVKQGRSRGRVALGGRRLQQVWAASVSAADGDYEYKAPSCLQCASPTQNSQQNTWPVCCEADQAYNWRTKKCATTVCYDGATLSNGQCVCAGGIAAYIDGVCSCYDNAEWSNTTSTCSCAGGADYNTVPVNPGDVPSCQCADGAAWTGTSCDCGVLNVNWDTTLKKCVCPSGLAWDSANGVCICPADATWSGTDGTCTCTAPAVWDATNAICV